MTVAPPGGRSGRPGLSRDALERLLALLDPDPARAARCYQQLRRRLTRLFEWRGARFPEDLTDETIFRVARKLEEGVEIRSDDPYAYFCGVAHLVFKELLRATKRERHILDPAAWEPREDANVEEPEDERMAALQDCLDRLSPVSRELILDYHEGERRHRIDNRRAIAARLGVPLNAMRIRVHRIRAKLERCVQMRLPER